MWEKRSRSASREQHHRLFERVRTCYTVLSTKHRGDPRSPPAFCCAGLSLVSLRAAPEGRSPVEPFANRRDCPPPPLPPLLLIHLSIRFFFLFFFYPAPSHPGKPGSLAPGRDTATGSVCFSSSRIGTRQPASTPRVPDPQEERGENDTAEDDGTNEDRLFPVYWCETREVHSNCSKAVVRPPIGAPILTFIVCTTPHYRGTHTYTRHNEARPTEAARPTRAGRGGPAAALLRLTSNFPSPCHRCPGGGRGASRAWEPTMTDECA